MNLPAPSYSSPVPFGEGPDLSRLSGPGLRAFLNLAEVWGLTLDEQRALLGMLLNELWGPGGRLG